MRICVAALLSGLALCVSSPVMAQPAPEALAGANAPSLDAAHRLVAVLMPAATREAMVVQLGNDLFSNLVGTMVDNASLEQAFVRNPRMRPEFERYVERVRMRSIGSMRDTLPGMIIAMEKAYARRFTIAEMEAMTDFFSTPAGTAYIRESATILSDPDYAEWQSSSIKAAMAAIEPERARFMEEATVILREKYEGNRD